MSAGCFAIGQRLAAVLLVAWTAALAAARVYDQNGDWLCHSETGDRFKAAYAVIGLAHVSCFVALTLAVAGLALVKPERVDGWALAGVAACASVLGAAYAGWLGPCP